MSLPIFQTDDKDLQLLQNRWATLINPVLSFAVNKGLILPSVSLSTGANVINHRLGRKLQGWMLVRNRASSTVFDTQDSNQMPDLTLQLTASADTVVDILVF